MGGVKTSLSRKVFVVFNTIFMIFIMICMVVPILKILNDSLQNCTVYGLQMIPKMYNADGDKIFTFIAYKKIFTTTSLRTPILISIYTTAMTTLIGLLISTLGAYVLIQKDMPGVKIFSYLLLFTMIFNGGLIPTFLVMKKIGLLDSLWAVILPMSMNVYNLVLMRSFFEQLPVSLFEAAEIDGCTPMGIFWKIVLPLSKAALASIGLFFAVAAWSEYFHYVIYIKSTNLYNFQYKLRDLFSDKQESVEGEDINVNTLKSAAIIVSIIPFMFIYPFCQKYFMTGVTMGAVKE
jgi:putative aldouronate transport system permease protein